MHDDESDVSCSEPASTRTPHGTDDLLRVLGDPRDVFGGGKFFLEDALEFFQPPLVTDVVANAIYHESFSSSNATTDLDGWTYLRFRHTRAIERRCSRG